METSLVKRDQEGTTYKVGRKPKEYHVLEAKWEKCTDHWEKRIGHWEPTMVQTFGDLDKALWVAWWRSKPDESGMQTPSNSWDSSLSSNTAIPSQPLIIFLNSQVGSYDSLAYSSSAWRIKFQLFSMTFNLYFLLLFFRHLLRRLLHHPPWAPIGATTSFWISYFYQTCVAGILFPKPLCTLTEF